MMINLILWRHAEAEYTEPNMDRQLSKKGHQQARMMSTWLQDHLTEPY